MIMRKKRVFFRRVPFSLSSAAERLLWGGLSLLLFPLLRLIADIRAATPFSPATAEDFGRSIEHVLAALAMLTLFVYLVEYLHRTTPQK